MAGCAGDHEKTRYPLPPAERVGGRAEQANRPKKNQGIKSMSNSSDFGELPLQYASSWRLEGVAEFILI